MRTTSSARLSEADLLAHYYRVVNEHPAEQTLDPVSIPPALADSLRRLADPSPTAITAAIDAHTAGGAEDKSAKTPRKRARKSEPVPATSSAPIPVGGESADVPKSIKGTKKRARQSEPPSTTTTATPATPAKRKRIAKDGLLAHLGPCPFVFRFQPKERGTYLESDFEWVEGKWCDGLNRGASSGRSKGQGTGKGKALEDSSTIPLKGEQHEGLLVDELDMTADDDATGGTSGTATTTAVGATPANVRVRGRRKTQGPDGESGSKRKKRDKAATDAGDVTSALGLTTGPAKRAKDQGRITAMSKPDSSYETPTRQHLPLPTSSQTEHPQSSPTPNGEIPSSQPTPTRPSKKGHASKKDRLSQLRLDSSQSGPSPSAPATASDGTASAGQPTTPQLALAAVEEDEDELEHTPVVAKIKEKAKKERKKRDRVTVGEEEQPADEAADASDKKRTKTKTSSTKRKSGDLISGAESANTSEESREIVERLLGMDGESAAPDGRGEVDTPMTKTKLEGKKHKHTSGADLFATPQANSHASREGTTVSASERKSKKHKKRDGRVGSGENDHLVESNKKDRRRKKDGPGWVVNTPEATKD